jgi:hypothetical protein
MRKAPTPPPPTTTIFWRLLDMVEENMREIDWQSRGEIGYMKIHSGPYKYLRSANLKLIRNIFRNHRNLVVS